MDAQSIRTAAHRITTDMLGRPAATEPHDYRVSYLAYLRGKWHPSSVGGMTREQAERVAFELRTTPTPGYRRVRITRA